MTISNIYRHLCNATRLAFCMLLATAMYAVAIVLCIAFAGTGPFGFVVGAMLWTIFSILPLVMLLDSLEDF